MNNETADMQKEVQIIWLAKLDDSRFEGFRLMSVEWTAEKNSLYQELVVHNGYSMFFTREQAIESLLAKMETSLKSIQQQVDYLNKQLGK